MKCKVCLSSLDSTPLILNAILVHGQWDRTAQGLRRPWLVVEAGQAGSSGWGSSRALPEPVLSPHLCHIISVATTLAREETIKKHSKVLKSKHQQKERAAPWMEEPNSPSSFISSFQVSQSVTGEESMKKHIKEEETVQVMRGGQDSSTSWREGHTRDQESLTLHLSFTFQCHNKCEALSVPLCEIKGTVKSEE